MLRGLAETEASLRAKHVPFYLLRAADPGARVAAFATRGSHRAAVVFTDMSPLRLPMAWAKDAAAALDAQNVPLVQVIGVCYEYVQIAAQG
jgi:hypothetical protein